jgi:hypothetical protein
MVTGKFDEWKTGRKVPDAWGGYYDAGDYDRHTAHLICSRNMLEMLVARVRRGDSLGARTQAIGNSVGTLGFTRVRKERAMLSVPKRRMPGGCMICTATFGNGALTPTAPTRPSIGMVQIPGLPRRMT